MNWLALLALAVSSDYTVRAQKSNAVCHSGYDWMSNSRGDSPCVQASYLINVCSQGYVTPTLQNTFHYTGVTLTGQNTCGCNSLSYQTLSACAVCQGQEAWLISYSTFISNCTRVEALTSQWAGPLPVGVILPNWAYISPYDERNLFFNTSMARAAGRDPERVNTATANPSSTASSTRPTPSGTNDPGIGVTSASGHQSSPIHSSRPSDEDDDDDDDDDHKSSTPIGAIVGGAVGGAVGLGLIGFLIFFCFRRRNRRTGDAATPGSEKFNDDADGAGVHYSPTQQPYDQIASPGVYQQNFYGGPGGAATGAGVVGGYQEGHRDSTTSAYGPTSPPPEQDGYVPTTATTFESDHSPDYSQYDQSTYNAQSPSIHSSTAPSFPTPFSHNAAMGAEIERPSTSFSALSRAPTYVTTAPSYGFDSSSGFGSGYERGGYDGSGLHNVAEETSSEPMGYPSHPAYAHLPKP